MKQGFSRSRIFGLIGVFWGGAVLLKGLVGGSSGASGTYAAGQGAGTVFGAILLIVGAYYVIKG